MHDGSSDGWSGLRSVIMQFYIMTLFPEMVMDGSEYKYYQDVRWIKDFCL